MAAVGVSLLVCMWSATAATKAAAIGRTQIERPIYFDSDEDLTNTIDDSHAVFHSSNENTILDTYEWVDMNDVNGEMNLNRLASNKGHIQTSNDQSDYISEEFLAKLSDETSNDVEEPSLEASYGMINNKIVYPQYNIILKDGENYDSLAESPKEILAFEFSRAMVLNDKGHIIMVDDSYYSDVDSDAEYLDSEYEMLDDFDSPEIYNDWIPSCSMASAILR